MNYYQDQKSSMTEQKTKGSATVSAKKARMNRHYVSARQAVVLRSVERGEKAQIFDKIVDTTTNKLRSSYAQQESQ